MNDNDTKALAELAGLVNLTWLMGELGRATRYGQRAGPQPWAYTRRLLAQDYSGAEIQQIIGLFESVGARDDVGAGEWLALHADQFPDQDEDGGQQ
jgi:hypothetical protein